MLDRDSLLEKRGASDLGKDHSWGVPTAELESLLWNIAGAMAGADRAGEVFLSVGIERWEKEGKLLPSEAAALRKDLASGEVRDAVDHLGAHMVLSVAIPIPIPGLRSLARFGWTAAFWVKYQARRFRHPATPLDKKGTNIHTLPVMFVVPRASGRSGCLSGGSPTAAEDPGLSDVRPDCPEAPIQAPPAYGPWPVAGSGSR